MSPSALRNLRRVALVLLLLGLGLVVLGVVMDDPKRHEELTRSLIQIGVILFLPSVATLLVSGLVVKDRNKALKGQQMADWLSKKQEEVTNRNAPPATGQDSSTTPKS